MQLRENGRDVTKTRFFSNDPGKWVFRVAGENGSRQNGTDKMVWTKCYVDKMVLDKW